MRLEFALIQMRYACMNLPQQFQGSHASLVVSFGPNGRLFSSLLVQDW